MCGRFTLRTSASDIAEVFDLLRVPDLTARFNVAPTQAVAAVRLDPGGQRQLVRLHWGLIPSWAEDKAIGSRMINARSESVATKPAFRQAFQRRRCLVVADGFYEWQKLGTKKQPYYLQLKTGRPFGFAGLWERWSREGQEIESCTIITTEPNELMRPIHDRMPVILPPDVYDQWLATEPQPRDQLEALLKPYPADQMAAYPVGTLVNNPRNERPECIQPA